MGEALHYLTLTEAARLLDRKQVSSVELTKAVFARVDEVNPRVNAFIMPMREQALMDAKASDRRRARGDARGALDGIPITLKDLYDTKGVRTTAASRIMAQRVPQRDATVVERLRSAGAVIAGKVNMSEFAIGGTHAEYGSVRNPWDTTRSPGGSSSGSGAAVATGMSFASMGSDTGGSIRIPAGFCGVTGIKPTYGRVSRAGVVTLSWTMDHAGPLARSVRDAAIVLRVIAGADPRDPTASARPAPDYARGLSSRLDGVVLGIPAEEVYDDLDPEVARLLDDAHRQLRRLGARLKGVSIPHMSLSWPAASTIMLAEGAAFHWKSLRHRAADFSDGVRGRFIQGLLTPAVAYLKAQQARAKLIEEFRAALDGVDAFITPTLPIPPNPLDTRPIAHSGVALVGRNTAPFNLTGLPALTVPCGFTKGGLPAALQIAAKPFDEVTAFKIGHAYQSATDWHTRRPPI